MVILATNVDRSARRFPPPWKIEAHAECIIVKNNGVYYFSTQYWAHSRLILWRELWRRKGSRASNDVRAKIGGAALTRAPTRRRNLLAKGAQRLIADRVWIDGPARPRPPAAFPKAFSFFCGKPERLSDDANSSSSALASFRSSVSKPSVSQP